MAAPGFSRSFSDANGYQQHAMEKPQIYTVRALYARSRDTMLTHIGRLLGRERLRDGGEPSRRHAPPL
jgi:hypothetical protein